MQRDTETKQTVIAVLTSVRDGQASSAAELFTVQDPPGGNGSEYAYPSPGSASPYRPGDVDAPAVNGTRGTTEQARRQALTAATYAMTLFHMLAAEFESACPEADVQAFLRRRALELVAGDEETA